MLEGSHVTIILNEMGKESGEDAGMPQFKNPSTLYNISLSKTRLWLVKVASVIFSSAGNFEQEECVQNVIEVNRYLGRNVPIHIIDELYSSSEILLDADCVQEYQNSPFEKQISFDPRVLLSLYIQENMKSFSAHRVVDDAFWKTTFCSLPNLVRLDLNKVCTDEILSVVGKNCVLLEFINIVSKSCHTRTKDRHNALKLQLCVSDTGLDSLAGCKQLREIQMTCIIRKGCGGRQITNDGIKRLLLSLPKLNRINYTDTGLLMDSMPSDTRLALVSVTDYHPRAARIPKIRHLCPHLTELNLTYAFSSDDYRSDVISALASSTLEISILSLTNFPFDDYLKNYLEMKGEFLKVFSFVSSFIQSINEFFRLLGTTCENLEHVHVHFHLFERGYITNQCPFGLSLNNGKRFGNLRSLIIKGVYWDSNHILPLLLKNAKFIKKIVLNNHSYSGCLDETLQLVQQTNQFLHLETLSFLRGVNVSFQFLRTFLLSCPVLKYVTVESESQAHFDLVVQLRDELLTKNMDINIDAYNTV